MYIVHVNIKRKKKERKKKVQQGKNIKCAKNLEADLFTR